MLTFFLIMSIVSAFVCGQLGYWMVWAVANRCRLSTAFFLFAGSALWASASGILIAVYLQGGGMWYMLTMSFFAVTIAFFLFHIWHWLFIEVWCRGQGMWYNLTKKKEAK